MKLVLIAMAVLLSACLADKSAPGGSPTPTLSSGSVIGGPTPGARVFTDRCRTLCREGLGGAPCGCPPPIVASLLNQRVTTWRLAHPEKQVIHGPRRDLCPSLCAQNLGKPLCACTAEPTNPGAKDWCPICHDLLYTERSIELWMKLGCHDVELQEKCRNERKDSSSLDFQPQTAPPLSTNTNERTDSNNNFLTILNNATAFIDRKDSEPVDWNLWCEIECEQNNGGLACDCDLLPLLNRH